ncbi:transposase [Bacillus aerolatus]|uniref:Transposase n=1 Tax=Bacillus aerolatus TaxID=2653354 RepID=A0A6I1FKR7_9BACI|nr:transposase [Bacillus aerolatus]KAB7706641.1 transposase [Bacillus aerolatus]
MARKLRVWVPGAAYHITCRGNRRAALFYDDADRRKYLQLLEETRFYFPFHLHAYCLMTNHIHLQVETIDHSTKDIMKMLNSRYAIYFNKRHELVGHVFQGRYGCQQINSIYYFLKVSKYIHLNPLEADIVIQAQDYPWSSYGAFIFDQFNPHVNLDKTLSYFPNPEKKAYRQFVESPHDLPDILLHP